MRMYSVIAGTIASSQNCPMFFKLFGRRDVARGGVGALTEEMPLGLLHEVFARAGIGEVEAVLVHQHGLLLQLLCPRFLGEALPNALAERAGIRRNLHALGLAAELDALHHPSHRPIYALQKDLRAALEVVERLFLLGQCLDVGGAEALLEEPVR